ncbi:unnamed protein product [Strongylus vulgaris]|uniref:Uncharacterized protein n=1 Tax=Strongylus vulgaris TaxID=40348 RepID=A0A3P7K063_STRVU|nr:unnamed protein product [Strongylus vulgaris]
MEKDLKEELNRRQRAAAAFGSLKEAPDQLTDPELRAHLATDVLNISSISRLRDPAEYVSNAKHRWADHMMRRTDDKWTLTTLEWIPREAKLSRGRPPTKWTDVFVTRMDQLNSQLVTSKGLDLANVAAAV